MAEEATTAEEIKAKTEKVKTLTKALNDKIAEKKAAETTAGTVKFTVTNTGLDGVQGAGESTAKYEGGKIIVTAATVEGYNVTGYKFTVGDAQAIEQPSNEYEVAIDTSNGDVHVAVEVVYEKETSELDTALVAYNTAVESANSMIDTAKNSDYKDVEAVKTAIAAAESERDAVIDKNNVDAVKEQTTAINNKVAALDLAIRLANRDDLLTKADEALAAAADYMAASGVESLVDAVNAAKAESEKADTTDVSAVEEANKKLNNAIVALNDAVKAAQNAEYTLSFTVSPIPSQATATCCSKRTASMSPQRSTAMLSLLTMRSQSRATAVPQHMEVTLLSTAVPSLLPVMLNSLWNTQQSVTR